MGLTEYKRGSRAIARGDTTLAQVHGGGCRVPVIKRGIPLLDVRGCRVSIPDLLDGSRHVGLDGDLHDWFLFGLGGFGQELVAEAMVASHPPKFL